MANENQKDPEVYLGQEDRLHSRRSGSAGLLCEGCGIPLTGKKVQWCTEKCRVATGRRIRAARVGELLASIEHAVATVADAVAALRELEPHDV